MTMHDPNVPRGKVSTRQGTKQTMNMRVLVTSLVLIVLIFAGLYVMFVNGGPQAPETPPAAQTEQPVPPTPTTPAP